MDDTLTDLLAADCDAGFERLVRTYADRLYAFTLALTGSPADAEECAQDAFVRAHRALRGWPPQRRATLQPSAWLHTIALNVVRNRKRGRAVAQVELDLEVADDPRSRPEAQALRRGDADRLRAALLGLPEAQREAVVLRHVQGMSSAETATSLGRPEGTVKSDVHRGLRRLRALLAGDTEEDGWTAA